jgi:hypothetical protein
VIGLALALLLPSIYWDGGPQQAAQIRDAGIDQLSVPANAVSSWKSVSGITVHAFDPAGCTKLPSPGVDFKTEEASATRQPWVVSNGWRLLRTPGGHFYYDAPGASAPLAAAEAYAYGVNATIHTDAAGLKSLAAMLHFLKSLPPEDDLKTAANIGYLDDGSPASGEFMNLLVRRNLLFRVVSAPDPALDLSVKLGTPDYPMTEAGNPSLLAEKVRGHLTDDKRLLRVYGSYTVIGRLIQSSDRARLFVLNYAESHGDVDGVHLRVLGSFPKQTFSNFGLPQATLKDFQSSATATEFTITKLDSLAVIDLAR